MMLNGAVVRMGALSHQVEPLPPYRPDQPLGDRSGADITPGRMCTHLWYSSGVVMPRVLTMRELRQGLSGVVEEVLAGEAVFAGSHRKPEVVLMSVRRYEQLISDRQRVVDSAAGSLQIDGTAPTDAEI
jgi:prevent-host-death family protein